MGWRRYCGFVLLVWSQGFQHVRPSHQPCSAPELNGGFLVPELKSYDHEAQLHYGCDNGRKPAVEGWWATSSCLNGAWSPEPQCVDENACINPEIHNVKKASDWVQGKTKISITCADGYDLKDHAATTECTNGTWSPVLLCEKSINSCGEPPQIPHAVIIHRGYKDFFPDNTRLQYECEKGFSVEGEDSIYCMAGNWTEGPTCTSRPGAGNEGVSTDTQKQPDTGGRSTTPGLNEEDNTPLKTKVAHCGEYQKIPNGDVVERDAVSLRYQCNAFYTQVGSGIVTCNSDGSWSHLPICKEAFCVLDPARLPKLRESPNHYIKDGEDKSIPCIWPDYYRKVKCTNEEMVYTECCHIYDINRGVCCFNAAEAAWQDQRFSEQSGSTGKKLAPKICRSSY